MAEGETPANATAEAEAAGGDFEAAMSAAMADDVAEGTPVEPDAVAPEPSAPVEKPDEGTEKPAEPKKDEKKPEPEVSAEDAEAKKLRAGFAALARDRGKLRDREAAAQQLETRAKAWETDATAFRGVKDRIVKDPLGLIREHGGDELVNKLLDDIVASEKSPAERQVEALQKRLDDEKQAAAQRDTEQLVSNWKANIVKAVQDAGEKYDLVNSLDHHEAVIDTITAYAVKYGGAALDVATAAQAVEDTLAKGLAKSKKFGARAPGINAQPAKGTTAPSARKSGSGTTLSSVHSSELPPSEEDLPLDPQERFKRLMGSLS